MRKLFLLLVAAILVLNLPMFGQDATTGGWTLTVGAGGGVPVGDFNNASNFGIGGVASLGYVADPNFTVSATSGYLHFSGKDVTSGGYTFSTAVNIVPILVGGQYFFMPPGDVRVYGAANAGLYLLSYSASTNVSGVSVSGSTSESKFGVSPTLGAQFKAGDKMNVDVNANYTAVFTDNTTTSWVGFGIGLEFGL
ncbi:MAG: outer membrane beta-barrel protein [Ignavibacteria bacterium]|nr:outer membrane beta-barrel protein [Ignavibacteria bacterium]MBI3765901.1 outer membrane beta-barrel protein [Ignavibacteriales bacterium]